MAKLTYLVIHCTATPRNRWITPQNIIEWHMSGPPKGRGWDRVGYSKLILLNGVVHSFVKENDNDIVESWELTYGVAGINSKSRHICYVGGLNEQTFKPEDTRTLEQRVAMEALVVSMINKHPDIKIAGHSSFANKACPCFNVPLWLKSIKVPIKNIYGG